MRRVERIIERVRRETENEEYGDTYGINDEECIDYLNDAQDRVYSEIVKTHSKFFLKEYKTQIVSGVEDFTLPTKIYLGQISLFEYSQNSNSNNFYRLKSASILERISTNGIPAFYIRKNKSILFAPIPNNNGFVRITYVERLPKIDKIRAKVLSVTTLSNKITSLVLDTSSVLDRTNLLKENYLSIVNKDGDSNMYGIPFTDINATTGEVTFDATWSFELTETISAGDFVTMGQFSVNRSMLESICERYLSLHLKNDLYDRDANQAGTQNQSIKMEKLLAEVIAAYQDNTDDMKEPPILDNSYLVF
jgi:hypothetical protein